MIDKPIVFPLRKNYKNDIEFSLDAFDFLLWREQEALREPRLSARLDYSTIRIFLGEHARFGRDAWGNTARWLYPTVVDGKYQAWLRNPDGTVEPYMPTTDDILGTDWYMLKPQYNPKPTQI